MMQVVAIDCDLRKIHAFGSRTGVIAKKSPNLAPVIHALGPGDIILFEIAGTAYARADSRAATHSQTRWAIYNAYQAGRLAVLSRSIPSCQMFVATSAQWTRGYDDKVRHKLAGASARTKDLRECETMIWSFNVNPSAWRPAGTYMEAL